MFVSRTASLLVALTGCVASACTSSPIEPLPPGLPLSLVSVSKNAANAGRVESIAVNPLNRDHAIIAMEFGGLWKTHGGGSAWFRVIGLPSVFVRDIEFGSDGRTVVAAVFRDNQTINGGGIYVSRDRGESWSRPPSGLVPVSFRTPERTSAHSVSHAPDERGLWYVGTDFGIAISRDDGATWTHVSPEAVRQVMTGTGNPLEADRQQDAVQSVLAMPGGRALAMTRSAVDRSDDRGMTWRKVIVDNFGQGAPRGGEPGIGSNKMDRSPFASWAFVHRSYDPSGGKLWFYELDSETKTLLPFPQGESRGPFVRVSKDLTYGGSTIRIWVGAGWDGYYVTRDSAETIRNIRSDKEYTDWFSFITPAGIHADLGDMGLDGDLQPVLIGSDGGIFKRHPTIDHRWISAATPGSGMNSYQIADLTGTNVTGANGRISTHLYFATQDLKIWASPNGGQTWPHNDSQEGYGLEVRGDAGPGEGITVGYRAIGMHAREARFSDALLVDSRPVPDVDENGHTLTGMGLPFFLSQQVSTTAKPSYWVRLRQSGTAVTEVYVSSNSGSNWTKTGDLNFMPAGDIKRTAGGVVAWLPVVTAGVQRIGLVPLTPTAGLFNNTIQTYDDSDVVRLPGSGGLGKRATMWNSQAVFGVHPVDWKFLIAPDIFAGDVKVSRDGGKLWQTDVGLTQQVLRGGALKLWDNSAYRMQVTEIGFDPYFHPRYGNRIFVGTRDAGIVCSADGGRSWRTIKYSDEIKYITGFHFHPDGGVYVSAYGHGLWYVKPTRGCPESYKLPWDMDPPIFDTSAQHTGAVALAIDRPDPPRGIADTNSPKLFLTASTPASGVPSLGPDNLLTLSGRGFSPGQDLALRIRDGKLPDQEIRADKQGRFVATVRLPDDLPFGSHTIAVTVKSSCECASVMTAEFIKAYSDRK